MKVNSLKYLKGGAVMWTRFRGTKGKLAGCPHLQIYIGVLQGASLVEMIDIRKLMKLLVSIEIRPNVARWQIEVNQSTALVPLHISKIM